MGKILGRERPRRGKWEGKVRVALVRAAYRLIPYQKMHYRPVPTGWARGPGRSNYPFLAVEKYHFELNLYSFGQKKPGSGLYMYYARARI